MLKIGEHLLEKKLISPKVLEHCLNIQSRTGELLGQILLQHNFINEESLARVLSAQASLEYWDKPIDHKSIQGFDVIPLDFCKEYSVVPIGNGDGTEMLLLADPFNKITNSELHSKGLNKLPRAVARKGAITLALASFVPAAEKEKSKIEQLIRQVISGGLSEGAMQKLVYTLVTQIADQDGSDIHIEPSRKTSDIRFRVDGMLHPVGCLPLNYHSNLVNVLYSLAERNPTEFTKSHDASFSYADIEKRMGIKPSGRQIDIRLSSLPSTMGAGVCLRILNKEKTFIPLYSLGYSPMASGLIQKIISRPHGLVLFTGPTGSGKTTTLYAILSELRDESKKIITIEDPVEVELPLAEQIEVNEKAGMKFSTAIRVFLRHDPDIILVGEIRDLETAQEALRAALTGHQTFSTLHSTDAFNCLTRLLDLGMTLTFLSQGLSGVVSQRLLRKLCQHCRHETAVPGKYKELLKDVRSVYEPSGCDYCRDGYHGRTVVAEVLDINPEIRRKMVLGDLGGVKSIVDHMQAEQKFFTLQQDSMRAVSEGITSIEEVERVVGIEL